METYYYMLWDCVDCGKKGNLCSPEVRACPSCDHPRTFVEFDQAYLPGDDASWDAQGHTEMTQAHAERLNQAGPSWFCTNCEGDNYGDEQACYHCKALRGASDAQLREALDYDTFQQYMDGHQGIAADLVEQFGEYGGMRATHGMSFDLNDDHSDQLERAQENRSAFQSEMQQEEHHPLRPKWDASDLPSSVESEVAHLKGDSSKSTYKAEEKAPKSKVVEPEKVEKTPRSFKWLKPYVGVAAAGLAFLGLIALLVWGFQTYEVQGEVSEKHWERHIYEQKWTPVTLSDWRRDLTPRPMVLPQQGRGERAGVKIIDCRMKHHHYEDYVCGTKEVSCTHMESYQESYSCTRQESYTETYSCTKSESYRCGETCSTSRGSNGMATRSCSPSYCTRSIPDTCTRTAYKSVPDTCTRTLQRPIHSSDTVDKYCERSIEKSWCTYSSHKWKASDHHVAQGDGDDVKWPQGSLGPLERERREASYTMTMTYTKDARTQRVKKSLDVNDFLRYPLGTPVTVVLNNFGSVKSVTPRAQ